MSTISDHGHPQIGRCGKREYPDKRAAQLRIYWCPTCHFWHMSHRDKPALGGADGDAPRESHGPAVTRETLFRDWQREVEARNECGPHNVSAYDYIHARLNRIGQPIDTNQAPK